MDNWLGALIDQAPSAAAVIVVVILFLKFLREEREANALVMAKITDKLDKLNTSVAETKVVLEQHVGNHRHVTQRATTEKEKRKERDGD